MHEERGCCPRVTPSPPLQWCVASAGSTYGLLRNVCQTGRFCPTSTAIAGGMPCPAGTYNPMLGSTGPANCTVCPPGYFCGSGASAPTQCAAGYFCPSGTVSGTSWACPAGTYSTALGAVDVSSECAARWFNVSCY